MKIIEIRILSLLLIYKELNEILSLDFPEIIKNSLISIHQQVNNKLNEIEISQKEITERLGVQQEDGTFIIPTIPQPGIAEDETPVILIENSEFIEYLEEVGKLKIGTFQVTYEEFDKQELINVTQNDSLKILEYL